jgi:hypothetical protein
VYTISIFVSFQLIKQIMSCCSEVSLGLGAMAMHDECELSKLGSCRKVGVSDVACNN